MSILIKRLPAKKWEDITREDVDNAIVFDDSEETRDRFCENDVVVGWLGEFGIEYIRSAYDSFDADRYSITTLFAGNCATAVYIPGLKEEETVNAFREIAWNFIAITSGRFCEHDKCKEEAALEYIGCTRKEWAARVGALLINLVLEL